MKNKLSIQIQIIPLPNYIFSPFEMHFQALLSNKYQIPIYVQAECYISIPGTLSNYWTLPI